MQNISQPQDNMYRVYVMYLGMTAIGQWGGRNEFEAEYALHPIWGFCAYTC